MNPDELDDLERELERGEMVEIVPIAEAAKRAGQDTSTEIKSGFSVIDDCIKGGFRAGDVNVITGIEGEGKTTLARMFTLNFAEAGIPSMWFSYEMSARELWDAFEEMGAKHELISYVPMELEHEIDWIFRHIQKGIREKGIKAVFIDTIADVSQTDKRRKDAPNYATVIDLLCKDVREFAIKNELVIFEMAHATKTTRSKSNETENSDIANSAGIKNAATNIFHLWRDLESDGVSYVKIGKSRRDGTKKGWQFKFNFVDNRLIPEGRHEKVAGESVWRAAK
jgi:hypothetical protein